jgi:hypothetical protein
VPGDLLVQANSALFTVNPLAFLFAGPALGGFTIAAAGTGIAFILDAASFAVGAVAIALIAARPAARVLDEADRRTIVQDIRESFSYVRRRVWIWGTLLWSLLVLPLAWGPYVVLLPFFVKNELGGDARDLGLVFSAGGASSVLVALLISQVGLPRRHIAFMFAAFGLGAVDLAIYALTSAPWQSMVVAFVASCGWTAGVVTWNTLLQRAVPAEILGRVRSIDWLAATALVPLSFVIVGPLAGMAGVRTVMVACGVLGAIFTVAAFLLPGIRDTERQLSLSG